jgi:hypothetical protein
MKGGARAGSRMASWCASETTGATDSTPSGAMMAMRAAACASRDRRDRSQWQISQWLEVGLPVRAATRRGPAKWREFVPSGKQAVSSDRSCVTASQALATIATMATTAASERRRPIMWRVVSRTTTSVTRIGSAIGWTPDLLPEVQDPSQEARVIWMGSKLGGRAPGGVTDRLKR